MSWCSNKSHNPLKIIELQNRISLFCNFATGSIEPVTG